MIQTVFGNEQELLKAIIQLHVPNGRIELDPMYFKGNFYKTIEPPIYRYDINPIVPASEYCDARSLCHKDSSISSMILDPPFMFGIHGKSAQYYSSMTHGIMKNFSELQELYQSILREAYRVLSKKGILIFKCQDFTDNKTTMVHCCTWQWATQIGFYAKDLAILHLPNGKVYNSHLKQRHMRKTHSYFWIFER